jgi:hypothetical protein
MTENTNGETKPASENEGNGGKDQPQMAENKEEDVEGMDTKAKGLMHLLQSSSVRRRETIHFHFLSPLSNRLSCKVIRRPYVGENEKAAG